MFVYRKENSDIKIKIFLDMMDVGSNELTQTVVVVFIVGRHFNSNKFIDKESLKHFPKIPCESIKSIDTVDSVQEVGSNELTRIVFMFKNI